MNQEREVTEKTLPKEPCQARAPPEQPGRKSLVSLRGREREKGRLTG